MDWQEVTPPRRLPGQLIFMVIELIAHLARQRLLTTRREAITMAARLAPQQEEETRRGGPVLQTDNFLRRVLVRHSEQLGDVLHHRTPYGCCRASSTRGAASRQARPPLSSPSPLSGPQERGTATTSTAAAPTPQHRHQHHRQPQRQPHRQPQQHQPIIVRQRFALP